MPATLPRPERRPPISGRFTVSVRSFHGSERRHAQRASDSLDLDPVRPQPAAAELKRLRFRRRRGRASAALASAEHTVTTRRQPLIEGRCEGLDSQIRGLDLPPARRRRGEGRRRAWTRSRAWRRAAQPRQVSGCVSRMVPVGERPLDVEAVGRLGDLAEGSRRWRSRSSRCPGYGRRRPRTATGVLTAGGCCEKARLGASRRRCEEMELASRQRPCARTGQRNSRQRVAGIGRPSGAGGRRTRRA